MGNKDYNRVYCSVLAKKGYTVVCVNYRLSPDVLYPSQVQDVMAAYKWIYDNADSYNIDLERVYVTGESAGGNLAYYTSLVETSPQLQELYGVSPSGLQIDALGLVSGMYEMKAGFNAPLYPAISELTIKIRRIIPTCSLRRSYLSANCRRAIRCRAQGIFFTPRQSILTRF